MFLGPIATALLVLLPKYELTPEVIERTRKREGIPKVVNIVLIVLILVVILIFMVRSYLQ